MPPKTRIETLKEDKGETFSRLVIEANRDDILEYAAYARSSKEPASFKQYLIGQLKDTDVLLEELEKMSSSAKVEVSKIALNDMDLSHLDFSNIDFIGTSITNCVLGETKFTASAFDQCSFSKVYLSNANLHQVRARNTSFIASNLSNIDASLATFDTCNFGSFDPKNAEGKVIAESAKFNSAIFMNTHFAEHNHFDDANFSGVIFSNPNKKEYMLEGSFQRANFSKANFIENVSTRRTNMQSADFTGACVEGFWCEHHLTNLYEAKTNDIIAAKPKTTDQEHVDHVEMLKKKSTEQPKILQPSPQQRKIEGEHSAKKALTSVKENEKASKASEVRRSGRESPSIVEMLQSTTSTEQDRVAENFADRPLNFVDSVRAKQRPNVKNGPAECPF